MFSLPPFHYSAHHRARSNGRTALNCGKLVHIKKKDGGEVTRGNFYNKKRGPGPREAEIRVPRPLPRRKRTPLGILLYIPLYKDHSPGVLPLFCNTFSGLSLSPLPSRLSLFFSGEGVLSDIHGEGEGIELFFPTRSGPIPRRRSLLSVKHRSIFEIAGR